MEKIGSVEQLLTSKPVEGEAVFTEVGTATDPSQTREITGLNDPEAIVVLGVFSVLAAAITVANLSDGRIKNFFRAPK